MLLMSVIWVTGCTAPEPEDLDAKTLYSRYCAGCHGDDGSGRFLRGIPANIQTEKSFAEIVQQIKNGSSNIHTGPQMPGFSQLSDRQVKLIASYLLKMTRE